MTIKSVKTYVDNIVNDIGQFSQNMALFIESLNKTTVEDIQELDSVAKDIAFKSKKNATSFSLVAFISERIRALKVEDRSVVKPESTILDELSDIRTLERTLKTIKISRNKKKNASDELRNTSLNICHDIENQLTKIGLSTESILSSLSEAKSISEKKGFGSDEQTAKSILSTLDSLLREFKLDAEAMIKSFDEFEENVEKQSYPCDEDLKAKEKELRKAQKNYEKGASAFYNKLDQWNERHVVFASVKENKFKHKELITLYHGLKEVGFMVSRLKTEDNRSAKHHYFNTDVLCDMPSLDESLDNKFGCFVLSDHEKPEIFNPKTFKEYLLRQTISLVNKDDFIELATRHGGMHLTNKFHFSKNNDKAIYTYDLYLARKNV